ncbi:DUF6064 family protein [Salinimicrobium soli]|uniref:DUF6064 family protein n=1 Tax=Salinimicrobium soli TaxID=1254399 RepID=UPI003AAB7C33
MKTPFTVEEFFNVFERYNTSVFPLQLIFIVLGVVAIFLLHKKKKIRHSFITGFLGFLWFWTGLVYHLYFFTSINNAAYIFGALFILQGLLFIREIIRNRLEYSFKTESWKYVGYIIILTGLLIYPAIGYLLEESFEKTISLGLPCPTTIFTFGFLMLTNIKFPKHLLIIPTLWALIGTIAATNFGVFQDYLMIISALIANFYLIKRK